MNYITKILLNFLKLYKSNYSTYKNIRDSIRFKGINIIEILILSLNSHLILFYLSNIKYYLLIELFNLISVS